MTGEEILKNGRAVAGSSFWIQTIINGGLSCLETGQKLEEILGERIHWLSPMRLDNYRQYELRELNDFYRDISHGFWPKDLETPSWSGLGEGLETGALYLLDVRSHPRELRSRFTGEEAYRRKLAQTLKRTHKSLKGKGSFNEEAWMNKYYGLGQGLTFWKKFDENRGNTRLIYLNLVDDSSLADNELLTSREAWDRAYDQVFFEILGGRSQELDRLLYYFYV